MNVDLTWTTVWRERVRVLGNSVMWPASLIAMVIMGCERNSTVSPSPPPETPFEVSIPRGLAKIPTPEDNPLTNERVALGKRLFFDKRLSVDRSISCASCHDPKKGWSNGQQFAAGVGGALGNRNSPTLYNVAYNKFQFWDGRADSLEEQALGPILNPVEMAMPSTEALVERVNEDPQYVVEFARIFPDGITPVNIAKAIASFERTILSGDSPYDRFRAGDKSALSESAQDGMKVFFRKAQCAGCHGGRNLTYDEFYNLGVGMDTEDVDIGREAVTQRFKDRGAFKTPTLREIVHTAPYMHDGSVATLEEVVELYDKGAKRTPQLADVMRRPLRLTDQEKQDLITFLTEAFSQVKPSD